MNIVTVILWVTFAIAIVTYLIQAWGFVVRRRAGVLHQKGFKLFMIILVGYALLPTLTLGFSLIGLAQSDQAAAMIITTFAVLFALVCIYVNFLTFEENSSKNLQRTASES